MRWPWSDRATERHTAASQGGSLHCDEWVEEPARIRELMAELTQQQADFTLVGRGQSPLQARLDAQALAGRFLNLHALGPADTLREPVTAVTQLNGIDLIFSSRVQSSGVGSWALEIPRDLIYLNMRRLFRAGCATGERLTLDIGPKLSIKAALENLSEAGACMVISPAAAAQVCASVGEIAGQLDLTDLSVRVSSIDVRHIDHAPEVVRMGVSFQLAEGTERQRLRQALHRRQVEELQKKKVNCAFLN